MLDRFGSTTNGSVAFWLENACSLGPNAIADPARLPQLADIWLKAGFKEPWRRVHVGLAYYRAGKFAEALRYLDQPQANSPIGWAVLAMVHHRLGHVEEARRWLAKTDASCSNQLQDALAATPLRLSLDWVWGPTLWREAKELIEGKPPLADPRLRLLRARAYTQLGEPKKAEAEFQAAVAVRPGDPEIWLARARVFLQLGQHDRAEADFAKILELKPDDPRLWIERGRYFAERGQHHKADAHFAKAAKLTPDELNRFLEAGWWVAGPYPYDLKLPCPPEFDADSSRP